MAMQITIFSRNSMGQNIYLLACKTTAEAVIIDAGCSKDDVAALMRDIEGLSIKAILLTHGHFDHITAAKEIQLLTGATIYCHASELELLANPKYNMSCLTRHEINLAPCHTFEDGDEYTFGKCTLKVLHTPGHTPGSVCYYHKASGNLFSGDTLFRGNVGRTDLPLSDEQKLKRNIKSKLFTLDAETRVFPGHGRATTIGAELKK